MSTSRKGLSFIHLNIQILYKHIDELKLSLSDYDIMSFTETWLSDKLPNSLLYWPGYTLFRKDRSGDLLKCKGGGIAVYVRDKIIDYAQLDQTMSNFTLDLEQVWIKLEIPHMKIIWIGIGYRPPSGGVKEAIVQLNNNIKIITDTQRNIETLIMGDFNIDYKKATFADFKLLI